MIEYPDLTGYLLRVFIALTVLSLCAFLFVRNAKRKARGGKGSGVAVEILSSLPLGKGVFFVVRCGPDVLAFTLSGGSGGACLMGRWSYEEWCRAYSDESD